MNEHTNMTSSENRLLSESPGFCVQPESTQLAQHPHAPGGTYIIAQQ
jgi:hypothetical protein